MSERPKLSRYCIACKREHADEDMLTYIERCERRGRDPLDAPKGGFLCPMCHWRCLLEMIDEGGLELVADQDDDVCAIVHTAFREFFFWSRRRVRRTCNEGRRSWCKLAAVEPPPLPPKRRRRKPRRKPCGL